MSNPLANPQTRLAFEVASEITFDLFDTKFWLICDRDKNDPEGRLYYQIACERPDTFTREMGEGRGGKAYLSPHMIKDEMVQLAFGLFKGYVEHEAREGFFYKKRRVFGPHMKVDNLWKIADDIATRT